MSPRLIFEIGSLIALKDEWKKVDNIRILMGDEVTKRTKKAFVEGLRNIVNRLDGSLEAEKQRNDFLEGVPAIVEAIRSGKIACRVYRKNKFHAKTYITHARLEVVGSAALVGSSKFTYPGLTENIELNVQINGRPVSVLQEWYEQHWNDAGRAAWYLYDLATSAIVDEPAKIIDCIRCGPEELRYCSVERQTLADIRAKIEKHIKNTYLKSVVAPGWVKPLLKAWMELS